MGQTPLCAIAFLAVYFVLDLPPTSHAHWLTKMQQIDFLGAFTLILAVISLLAGLDSGSNLGWSNQFTIISLSLAPVFFALFIFVEIKIASHPFAPGHIIFDAGLFACYMSNFFGVAGQMGIVFFMPLFFQAVQGISATGSGALLVPSMIAGVMASLGAGVYIRKTEKFYWITVWSFGVLLFSLVPLGLSLRCKVLIGEVIGLVFTALGAGCGTYSPKHMVIHHGIHY